METANKLIYKQTNYFKEDGGSDPGDSPGDAGR